MKRIKVETVKGSKNNTIHILQILDVIDHKKGLALR